MQAAENRRVRAARLWAALGERSRCPICGRPFTARDLALVCPSGHAYDLSAAGTAHLLRGRGASPIYTRELFLARRRIIESGLFGAIIGACAEGIARLGAPKGLLVDAGCGDAALGFSLARALDMPYAGVDASAEAIRVAGRDVGGEGLLLVGDLANLPFQDASAAVILNLLSPASYAEFRRVLAAGGLLCKVIRGARHLWELRADAGAEDAPLESDSEPRDALRLFQRSCEVLSLREIEYPFPVAESLWEDLVAMTPMTTHYRERMLSGERAQAETRVTVHVTVGLGRFA